jgi:hypothetical protein
MQSCFRDGSANPVLPRVKRRLLNEAPPRAGYWQKYDNPLCGTVAGHEAAGAGMIVGQIGAGKTIENMLAGYPYVEKEDIIQAPRYVEARDKAPGNWNDAPPY